MTTHREETHRGGTTRELTRTARWSGQRAGSVVLVGLSAATLFAVHVWPGWAVVPFLTAATTQVLGVFTASLVLTALVHALDAVIDRPRLRAAGDVATSAVGLVVTVRLWQVFPFGFAPGFDWALLVRGVLVLALFGGVIGVVTGMVALVRGGGAGRRADR
jgi:hypothetical protein